MKNLWGFKLIFLTGIIWSFSSVNINANDISEYIFENIQVNTTIKEGKIEKQNYSKGDKVAIVTIPRLGIYREAIVYGLDGKELKEQVSTLGYSGGWGMFGDCSPAEVGAHNYELFKYLPKMEEGDTIIIENDIDTYTYEVIGKMIFDNTKDNWKEDVYLKSEPYSLSLITCYPIEKKETDDRYIVFTKLIGGTIDSED